MMPLLCFDLIQGRSEKQIEMILDATHEILVKSFNVPQRDRYQIVREHAPSRMIVEDTGLGIVRTPNMLVLQVTTRPRSRAMKQALYTRTQRVRDAELPSKLRSSQAASAWPRPMKSRCRSSLR